MNATIDEAHYPSTQPVDLSPFQTISVVIRQTWVITGEQDGISVTPPVRMSGGEATLRAAKSFVDDLIHSRHRGHYFGPWTFDNSHEVCKWDFWYRIDTREGFAYYIAKVVTTE